MNMLPVWQTQPLQRALSALAEGQLGHATLITGPEHLGQAALARALAQRLLCTTAHGDAPACGECRACTQTRAIAQRPQCTTAKAGEPACGQCRGCIEALASRHPDLRIVTLEINEKTEKLRTEIAVEQIRKLSEWLALTSQHGGAQVVIIESADLLNRNAANALLKTLEEPAPGRYLLLATSRPHRLPATIRSRCQHIALRLPDHAAALDWLRAQGHDGDSAATALTAARGNPGVADRWLRDGTLETRKAVHAELLRIAKGALGPLELAALWAKDEQLSLRLALAADFAALLSSRLASGETVPTPQPDRQRLGQWFDQANACRELLSTTVRSDLALVPLLIAWREVFAQG